MTNPQRHTSRASMEDILSSIRRIIDESVPEGATEPIASAQPPYMNGSDRGAEPHAMEPLNPLSLRPMQPDPPKNTVPEVEPVQEQTPAVPAYDNRFTADDAEAFREVAQVLQSTASMLHGNEPAIADPVQVEPVAPAELQDEEASQPVLDDEQLTSHAMVSDSSELETLAGLTEEKILPLISNEASQSIAATFTALDEVLRQQTGEDLKSVTQEMLRPMLAEWLDENLPSMVERLVRQEIERIARGEPRAA
ncbi:MAG: DUF2497 domain-containing protein [Pseudomonadota bacterium]